MYQLLAYMANCSFRLVAYKCLFIYLIINVYCIAVLNKLKFQRKVSFALLFNESRFHINQYKLNF